MKKYSIYRMLDRSPSLFGIQGGYFIVFGVVLGVGFLFALILGGMFTAAVGIVVFMVFAVIAYFVVMFLQEKYSEKELRRFLSNLFLPGFIRIAPGRLNMEDINELW